MALSKVDYNSLNVTAAASKALKWNSAADGFETGNVAGALVLLETITASSSDLITFDSNIDDTYDEYIFKFMDIHPQTDQTEFAFNFRDGSTAYDAVKTTTLFLVTHTEDDTSTSLAYNTVNDMQQGTGFLNLLKDMSADNDASGSGVIHLFNPSSTTFVKHFIATTNYMHYSPQTVNYNIAGYCNTTSAIDGVQFKMVSGNVDA